jgi:hypothetical protein
MHNVEYCALSHIIIDSSVKSFEILHLPLVAAVTADNSYVYPTFYLTALEGHFKVKIPLNIQTV